MLRNVIVHIANEQPFMADLLNEPSPSDVSLICRNMRTMAGKKPVSVDFADSTFVVPVAQIRFLEIPAASYEDADTAAGDGAPAVRALPAPRGSGPRGSGSRPNQVRGKRSKTGAPAPRELGSVTVEREPDQQGENQAENEPETIVLLGSTYHDVGLDADLLRRIREA